MAAYVLIQTAAGADPIAPILQDIGGIVLAEELRGPYDAIALARAGSSAMSLDQILTEVRELPGVTRAITAPLIDSRRPALSENRDEEAA